MEFHSIKKRHPKLWFWSLTASCAVIPLGMLLAEPHRLWQVVLVGGLLGGLAALVAMAATTMIGTHLDRR